MTNLGLRLARLALALVGVAAVCWACNAPFIPIPPPGQTATFTSALVADGDGGTKTVWIAHGPPNPNAAFAHFDVFDADRMAGVIAEARDDGSFDSPPMDGTEGDRVLIHFEPKKGPSSMDVCFTLTTGTEVREHETQPSAPLCPQP
ncbi:MAG TPA: hypothetical protein VHL80_11510 [Polyangia bacterium]|nr:hypothetical protein [Polyangia bacterium]